MKNSNFINIYPVYYDRLILIGQMDNSDGTNEKKNRVYSVLGCCPTIDTYDSPLVLVPFKNHFLEICLNEP